MTLLWWCSAFLLVAIGAVRGKCPPQDTILPCRCLTKNEQFQIWCSHSDLPSVLDGLRSIGQHIKQPIDELILENNYLPSLPGRTFLPLKIMRLMLRYNGLERVSSDWLVGLEKSLMELFIVEPDLRSLPEDSLNRIDALEAVTIQSNLIKRFPLFTGLNKLRYMQLESLSLLELFPRGFKDLPSLETIHIGNSPRLARLDAGFLQDLPRLKIVNISYCGVNWLHPRAITRLPSLTELSLIGNKIVDVGMVGRAARELPALEILRLDHNYVDKIGEAAFVDLPSLKKLHLSNNQIREIEYGSFHRVPQLRSVDLSKNMVRRVHPESFLQHSGSGLEELFLVDNDIGHVNELRSLLDTLPRLTFLDLSYNNIEAIPFGALRGHPTLEHLHLDYNKIHLIDTEAFMAMPALRELRLRNNSLTDVLDGPLWNLPALKGLDLSGNYYRRLDRRLLANLPSLRRIDLSRNELTLVDPEAFFMTPELEHVNLSSNGLATLHPGTFRHLLKLYELDVNFNYLVEMVPNLPRGIEYVHMSHNKIDQLSNDIDLPALRMLDISSNQIHRIPANALRLMPQLRRLYFGRNALQRLEEGALAGMTRLEILDFNNNNIAQIHPNSLREMIELRELNLRNNRLELLFAEVFKDTPRLRKLDVSKNQLTEILPGTLDKTRELQEIDASNNLLVQLPSNLFGMKKLKKLDLTNNRLKNLNPETLSSLMNLKELKLANNFINELKTGAFDNLHHLRSLNLDSNEIEFIETNSIRGLPVLKSLKISRNKLKELPNFAFNNLPSLQYAELQENQIKIIANNAFHLVPHLLLLNLSFNHLENIHDAGLKSLKSLEMLDVSNNRIARVTSKDFEKMEWLVELRMSDNEICAVHGSPFDAMSRLRVLSMKNNKMMTLPEQTVQKLRSNIAVLDLDGNPLACACNLLWLQAWVLESNSLGPKCVDGSLLREMRLSREDCRGEHQRAVDLVAPGCESELLTAPPGAHFGTSQVFAPQWMNLKANRSKTNSNEQVENKNHITAPLPEESEYFYEDYVDYPYNETSGVEKQVVLINMTSTARPSELEALQNSPHFTPGDTPTIYAASKNKIKDIPKEVVNSPSTSGFTFFGVPLPSINFNKLLGMGRNEDKNKNYINKTPVAERKTAIVNNPARVAGPTFNMGRISNFRVPPDSPEIQSGGFIPLLPGQGGFKPIANPNLQQNTAATNQSASRVEVVKLSQISSTTNLPSVSAATTESYLFKKENFISGGHPVAPTVSTLPSTTVTVPQTSTPIFKETLPPIKELLSPDMTAKIQEVTFRPRSTTKLPLSADIETVSNAQTFDDIFEEVVDNVEVPTVPTALKIETTTFTTTSSAAPPTSTTPTPMTNLKEEIKKAVATPLSALLVPGGQQPEFRPGAGRSTITKVQSPHVGGSAPLLSDLEVGRVAPPQPHREAKTSKELISSAEPPSTDTSWYFANYNKTNLEPFVGVGANGKIGLTISCWLLILGQFGLVLFL